MATKVVMAQLSPTMEEGKLVEWKVEEGDEVSQGDVVAEIETDKANMEVEAMGSGVLRKILVAAGQTVPVGALIGVIAPPDEDIDDLVAGASNGGAPSADGEVEAESAGDEVKEAPGGDEPGATGARETAEGRAPETADTKAPEAERDAGVDNAASAGGRLKASPVARRIAQEEGLDLTAIDGSGPGGRIVKADVEAALAIDTVSSAAAERAAPAGAHPAPAPVLEDRTEEATQMRKAIARRLTQSIGPVPHFFLTTEIDMGRALELRAELNDGGTRGGDGSSRDKIGVNDLLVKATAEALQRHPEINASWEGDSIRYHGSVDIGIAVALDEGLITPIVRDAASKGLRQIGREARDLIGRARERKLTPEEYQGATFSVSNLGMFEIDQFTAIINPPESGILAIGQTVEKPVVVEGEVTVRKRMRVTMSCDHRVIDGATGARFLATFKAMLENPLEMIL